MQYFNPDEIDVEVKDYDVIDDNLNVDWNMSVPTQGGTAYFRIPPELRDFIKLCNEKHGVIGFEYDLDDPGLNFGVILRDDKLK